MALKETFANVSLLGDVYENIYGSVVYKNNKAGNNEVNVHQ